MNWKNLTIGASALGIIAASLSLSACGGGSSSPQATTVPSPVAAPQTPPGGYSLPSGTAANNSTVYVASSASGDITGIALPQSLTTPAIQINAPNGITLSNLLSALVQQFGSTPVALVISSIAGGAGGILVNVSASPISASVQTGIKATNVTWNGFPFGSNVVGTSTPVAVAANNGAYMGTSTNSGGFLAF